ncbi:MAG: hypothetical protein ACFFCK_04970 [Promethearchaeota archaeon]
MTVGRSTDLAATARAIILFGVLQFFLLTFLAAALYPGGYDYFGYYFSDLGAVTARNGEANIASGNLFFLALTTASITCVPFWVALPLLFDQSRGERITSLIGSALGLTCSPLLIGVTLFPMDSQLETHFVLVLTHFSLFSFAVLSYSIALILGRRHHYSFSLLGLTALAIGILLMANPTATYSALLQKVVVYSYFVWIGALTYLIRTPPT